MMLSLPRPTKYALVAAWAEGQTELTAFDKALLKANVGNVNLVRLSSILPPHAEYQPEFELAPGILLPIAYATTSSSAPGEVIAAAIAIGLASPEQFGVIMEFHGQCSEQEAREAVTRMVEEAFEARGMPLNDVLIKSVAHCVRGGVGCVFVGVPMFY
jgi:arginine decarboxylase